MLWKPLNVVVQSLDVQQLGRSLQITAAIKPSGGLKRPRTAIDYYTNTVEGRLCEISATRGHGLDGPSTE